MAKPGRLCCWELKFVSQVLLLTFPPGCSGWVSEVTALYTEFYSLSRHHRTQHWDIPTLLGAGRENGTPVCFRQAPARSHGCNHSDTDEIKKGTEIWEPLGWYSACKLRLGWKTEEHSVFKWLPLFLLSQGVLGWVMVLVGELENKKALFISHFPPAWTSQANKCSVQSFAWQELVLDYVASQEY